MNRPWLQDAVVERVLEGWHALDISDDLDISPETVYRRARRAGIVFRHINQSPTKERRARAIQDLREGATIAAIMRQYRVTRNTAKNYARIAGVRPPDNPPQNHRSADDKRKIISLWRKGSSLRDVAARVGVSPGVVSGVISRAGAQRRGAVHQQQTSP